MARARPKTEPTTSAPTHITSPLLTRLRAVCATWQGRNGPAVTLTRRVPGDDRCTPSAARVSLLLRYCTLEPSVAARPAAAPAHSLAPPHRGGASSRAAHHRAPPLTAHHQATLHEPRPGHCITQSLAPPFSAHQAESQLPPPTTPPHLHACPPLGSLSRSSPTLPPLRASTRCTTRGMSRGDTLKIKPRGGFAWMPCEC